MAPSSVSSKNSAIHSKSSISHKLKFFYKNYVNAKYGKSLLFDPAQLHIVSIGILLVEFVLNIIVVQRVKYTEIDWIAYMQECEGFLNGTTNYALLKGDTINITLFSNLNHKQIYSKRTTISEIFSFNCF